MKKNRWQALPSESFETGRGFQRILVNTHVVRVFWQKFRLGTRVKYHSHPDEWEVVLRFGWGIALAIYPPSSEHCLFGPNTEKTKFWWSIISIKIGKKP